MNLSVKYIKRMRERRDWDVKENWLLSSLIQFLSLYTLFKTKAKATRRRQLTCCCFVVDIFLSVSTSQWIQEREISKGKKDSRQHEDHQYLFIFVTRKWIVNATLALITSIIFRFFIFYLIKHTHHDTWRLCFCLLWACFTSTRIYCVRHCLP